MKINIKQNEDNSVTAFIEGTQGSEEIIPVTAVEKAPGHKVLEGSGREAYREFESNYYEIADGLENLLFEMAGDYQ